jgi:hypothetical protein
MYPVPISDDLHLLRNDILELVKKNKTIPNFLNSLMPEDPRLLCLKKAIRNGNFRARIWNNPHCNLYLIYLIQENRIPFWQGITAYVYLIAKMQYTETQELRQEDHDVKFNYRVNIVSLVKAGKITVRGYEYLFGVMHALEKLNVHLNFSELVDYVLELPRIEQWLIETEFDHHWMERRVKHDRLIYVLISNLPLLQQAFIGRYEDPSTHYFVPSSSLIHYFLKIMNEQPMRMRPVLGSPGFETLYQWHERDFHPVSLYATQIISNPKEADGYRCGPFALWLHDIGHTFWASMLSKEQREYIFTMYIPALRCLKDMAKACRDNSSLAVLEKIEIEAYDFDLTAIVYYLNQKTRFDTYLAHTLGKNPIYPYCLDTGLYENEAIGRAEGDGLYFLLHRSVQDPKLPESYKIIYTTIINFISTGEGFRNQRIVNALQTLAKNAASHPEALFANKPPSEKLDLLDWHRLLHSNRSSKELWLEMTGNQDLAEKLLEMIELGLNFFHPYSPMTGSKRLEMLKIVENQPLARTKTSTERGHNGNISVMCRSQFFAVNENISSALPATVPNRYKL